MSMSRPAMRAEGMHGLLRTAVAVLALLAAGGAAAQELTPLGALRAGNKHETIPPWTGGMAEPIPGARPDQHHPDPFVDEGRWFTVKAAEVERYASRLSAGLRHLLETYPQSFEVPMFPTRRTAAFPQRVYDATAENAKSAKLTENGLVLTGARTGIPFPEPANGTQAMWNHLLRWRGDTLTRFDGIAVPDAHGHVAVSMYREELLSNYALGTGGNVSVHYKRTGVRPKEIAGGALLLLETLNPLATPRAGWYRAPGAPQVQRAPDFSYDTPDPATGGIRTADMLDMFSGLPDRFDFTLVGRREMYVPYNAYRLNGGVLGPGDYLWSAHPNPTFLRYELHRVWMVEATLKRGFRHAFPRRVYYLDEDSWQIVMAEHYDREDKLARYAEAHGVQLSTVPAFVPTLELTYDIPGGRYVANGLDFQEKPPQFGRPAKPEDFTPDALVPKRR